MKVHRINRLLAMRHLALQTTGASDGQTFAGATATGTHGAAIRIGGMHDTVRAVHLMVAPDRALLVQPASRPFKVAAVHDLSSWLGFPTELCTDDDLFAAARLHLGALGLVLNMVVEAVPLYFLRRVQTPLADDDPRWTQVLGDLDPTRVAPHGSNPDHLELVLCPYRPRPSSQPRAWLKTMHKLPYMGQGEVDDSTTIAAPPNADTVGLVAELLDIVGPIANAGLRKRLSTELVARYGTETEIRQALPGVMFGPMALPRGHGHSVELCVDARRAEEAVATILDALDEQMKLGHQYMGGIGVRFVGRSSALLAPNLHAPSCFIELPGVRTRELTKVYAACGRALDHAGIVFGSHWGQYDLNTRRRIRRHWGDRAERWTRARAAILSSAKAREVFASPILARALD
jgi:hypothetical protein